MKALILIDSFKGTITSKELGQIMQEELYKKGIISDYFSISDGGDGFLDAISGLRQLEKVEIKCQNPFGKIINSYYLIDKTNKTAYIELAKASGINLVKKEELNPYLASTYGFGEMIYDAIKNGNDKIILGVGGSATNDGGAGMLEALGVEFYKENEKLTNMNNQKLKLITSINTDKLQQLTKNISFLVLSDVTNPLLGKKGATYVFGPQKGAKDDDLKILEENIYHYATIANRYLKSDETNYPGSGAVGGCGYALRAFLKADFIPGIKYLLRLLKDNLDVNSYNVIISGEGRIDSQTLDGKVISGIIQTFPNMKKILVCAINELGTLLDTQIYSIVPQFASIEESMANPLKYYRLMCQNIEVKNE